MKYWHMWFKSLRFHGYILNIFYLLNKCSFLNVLGNKQISPFCPLLCQKVVLSCSEFLCLTCFRVRPFDSEPECSRPSDVDRWYLVVLSRWGLLPFVVFSNDTSHPTQSTSRAPCLLLYHRTFIWKWVLTTWEVLKMLLCAACNVCAWALNRRALNRSWIRSVCPAARITLTH